MSRYPVFEIVSVAGIVSEDFSQLGDGPGQGLVADNDLRPYRRVEVFAGDGLAGMLGQADEHVDDLGLYLGGLFPIRNAVEPGLHQPGADVEIFLHGSRRPSSQFRVY